MTSTAFTNIALANTHIHTHTHIDTQYSSLYYVYPVLAE